MTYRLSVLDQSPIAAGSDAAQAIRNTLDLARAADALGYHRYWLAEHHASRSLAGVAPEALIGPVALATNRIRVGSGGVMLPHYSPYKVAETFSLLSAMAPGRIDLGLGRAPGSDQRTAFALQRDRTRRMPSDFPEQLDELTGYLDATLPEDHAFASLQHVMPTGGGRPELWMLGSSPESAIWAAERGLPYCFADFINSDGAHLVAGTPIPVPPVEEALAWLEANPAANRRQRRTVLGTPAEVRRGLDEVAADYGADELMLVNILPDHAARRRSYELLAAEYGLAPTAQAA